MLWSVSVRTKVPDTNVTPMTMARAVRARRSLCASRPLMVTRHMSATEVLHLLQHDNRLQRGELGFPKEWAVPETVDLFLQTLDAVPGRVR